MRLRTYTAYYVWTGGQFVEIDKSEFSVAASNGQHVMFHCHYSYWWDFKRWVEGLFS